MPDAVKEERWHRFMAAQQEVSRELLAAKVGQTIDVIIDEVDEEGAIGRSQVGRAGDRRFGVSQRRNAAASRATSCGRALRNADEYDLWAEMGATRKPAR